MLKLADSLRSAGTGTAIEITRARVQLANDQQRLLAARSEQRKALLNLMRLIGLSMDSRVDLTTPLATPDPNIPPSRDFWIRPGDRDRS